MNHLGIEIVEKAQRDNLKIGAYVKYLDLFGVVGVIGQSDMTEILTYLKKLRLSIQISFFQSKGLIWCPETISEVLDKSFCSVAGIERRRTSIVNE